VTTSPVCSNLLLPAKSHRTLLIATGAAGTVSVVEVDVELNVAG
jgi:hypothetical protein